MKRFIPIALGDGSDETVLIEVVVVEPQEPQSRPPAEEHLGPEKAGLLEMAEQSAEQVITSTTKVARRSVNEAIAVACQTATMFAVKINTMPKKPQEAELTFGLTITSEGDVGLVSAGMEATYNIRMVWKQPTASAEAEKNTGAPQNL